MGGTILGVAMRYSNDIYLLDMDIFSVGTSGYSWDVVRNVPSRARKSREGLKIPRSCMRRCVKEDLSSLDDILGCHYRKFLVDSGASDHVCPSLNWFEGSSITPDSSTISVASLHEVHASACGVIDIYLHGGLTARLYDVLHVGNVVLSILLVAKATHIGWEFRFHDEFCDIYIPARVNCIHIIVPKRDRLYYLKRGR
jgi:hypothetical protein